MIARLSVGGIYLLWCDQTEEKIVPTIDPGDRCLRFVLLYIWPSSLPPPFAIITNRCEVSLTFRSLSLLIRRITKHACIIVVYEYHAAGR